MLNSDREQEQEQIEEKQQENIDDNKKSFLMKWGGLIFIIAVILVFVILAVSGINFGQWLATLAMSFYHKYGLIGIYIGVFIISIFGNFTVIFPVPYVIALIVLSAVVPESNPLYMGLAGGAGAGLGEVSAWLIGRGSKELIGDKSEKMQRMKGLVDRGWAPLLIFIFAATPLPDDAFLVVLGYASYSIVKTLVWCFFGKFILCFLCAALPRWLAGTDMGNLLFYMFGIADPENIAVGNIPPSTPQQMITSTITWVVSLVVIFLLVYIDWGKLLSRKSKENNSTHPNEVLK